MLKRSILLCISALFFSITGCGGTGPIGTPKEECLANCDIKAALDCQYEQLSDYDCRLSCETYDNFEYTQECLDAEAAYYHCMNNLEHECGNFGALPPMSEVGSCSEEMEATTEFCRSQESG